MYFLEKRGKYVPKVQIIIKFSHIGKIKKNIEEEQLLLFFF